jgi:sugar O-acyltransferase (sialic acid O-acetyltransferase NeuD family)
MSLAEIETSKSALEIEAPGDGFVLQLFALGQKVSVGEPIAYLFPSEDALTAFVNEREAAVASPLHSDNSARVTAKARQRAIELGVDIGSLTGTGLITVKDVESAAARTSVSTRAEPAELAEPLSIEPPMRRLLIIGAGLGATQVFDILSESEDRAAVGIVDDDPAHWRREIAGVPVVGGSSRIAQLWESQSFDAAVIAISTSVTARARLRALCQTAGVPLENVIDPRVKISAGVTLGTGNVICAFTHFGTETQIGDNNFISAFNSFDHHNVLGSDISTGPGCMTSGEVHLGDRVRLGTGIFIEPKLTIGEGSVVASGAIVLRSVPPNHAVKTKVVTTTVVPIRDTA